MARWAALPALAAAAAGLWGCAAPIPQPGPEQAQYAAQQWPGTTLDSLQAGRAILVRRCSECHSAPAPTKLKPEKWPHMVEVMGKKAKLTDAERETLLRYLLAMDETRKP